MEKHIRNNLVPLSQKERMIEDMSLMTVKDFFIKYAKEGIVLTTTFQAIKEEIGESIERELNTTRLKSTLRKLMYFYRGAFTAKEMSFIVNHTLGTLINENVFKKE